MYRVFKLTLFILLTSQAFHLAAQEEDLEAPDVYQVEFILFKHANPELDVLEYEHVSDLFRRPEDYAVPYPYNISAPSPKSRPALPESSELLLGTAEDRLRRSSDFEVLTTYAWIEKLYNDSEGLPVLIETKAIRKQPFYLDTGAQSYSQASSSFAGDMKEGAVSSGSELKDDSNEITQRFRGSIQIKRSRYTHAYVQIDYEYLAPYAYDNLVDWFLSGEGFRLAVHEILYPINQEIAGDTVAHSSQVIRTYRLKQSRRVRDGEIHYIDHPFIGVVISIKKLESEIY